MATRGGGRGSGSQSRRPASKRPSARPSAAAKKTRQSLRTNPAIAKVTDAATSTWRGRLEAARSNRQGVRRVALGVTLLFLVILVAPTLKAYWEQQSDIRALREKVAQQEKTVAELQEEQARWEDPAYVEQQARTRLKFVKAGEKSYTVIDPKATDESTTIAPAGTDAADPWYDTIWSSMQAADVPANQRR